MSCCCGRRKLNTNGKFKNRYNLIANVNTGKYLSISQEPNAK